MSLNDNYNSSYSIDPRTNLVPSPPLADFMKEKKRTNPVLVTVAKKRDFAGISAASGAAAATTTASSSRLDDVSSWGADMPPAKRMRTASAASSSSSVGSLS